MIVRAAEREIQPNPVGGNLISILDDEHMVEVHLVAGYEPSRAQIHHWHNVAGDLGYGIKFFQAKS